MVGQHARIEPHFHRLRPDAHGRRHAHASAADGDFHRRRTQVALVQRGVERVARHEEAVQIELLPAELGRALQLMPSDGVGPFHVDHRSGELKLLRLAPRERNTVAEIRLRAGGSPSRTSLRRQSSTAI
jgi:hypothetical protein